MKRRHEEWRRVECRSVGKDRTNQEGQAYEEGEIEGIDRQSAYLGRDKELREPVESPLEVARTHVEEVHRIFRVRVGVARPSVGAEIRGVAVAFMHRGQEVNPFLRQVQWMGKHRCLVGVFWGGKACSNLMFYDGGKAIHTPGMYLDGTCFGASTNLYCHRHRFNQQGHLGKTLQWLRPDGNPRVRRRVATKIYHTTQPDFEQCRRGPVGVEEIDFQTTLSLSLS